MIDRALNAIFRVISEEAVRNPAFGKKIEDALVMVSQELAEKRLTERSIEGLNPLVEYRRDAAGLEARLARLDAKALKALVLQHRLDPAGTLKGAATKRMLIAHIVEAARRRAVRDASLFDY